MTDKNSWNSISGRPKQNIYIVEIQIELYHNLLKHNIQSWTQKKQPQTMTYVYESLCCYNNKIDKITNPITFLSFNLLEAFQRQSHYLHIHITIVKHP